jgi:hypothetical protein
MIVRSVLRAFIVLFIGLLAACASSAATTPEPLTQSFRSSDGTIMLQYPAGWTVSDQAGQVVIANSQAAVNAVVPAPGQFQARMFGTPISAIANLNPSATPRQVIDFFADSLSTSGVTFNSASELTIGDRHDAARLEGSGTDGQAVVLVVGMGNGIFLFVTATTAPGELSRFEPTLQSIVSSVVYTPLIITPEATP